MCSFHIATVQSEAVAAVEKKTVRVWDDWDKDASQSEDTYEGDASESSDPSLDQLQVPPAQAFETQCFNPEDPDDVVIRASVLFRPPRGREATIQIPTCGGDRLIKIVFVDKSIPT